MGMYTCMSLFSCSCRLTETTTLLTSGIFNATVSTMLLHVVFKEVIASVTIETVLLYSNFIMYKALAIDTIMVKTWTLDIMTYKIGTQYLYVIMPLCPCLNH